MSRQPKPCVNTAFARLLRRIIPTCESGFNSPLNVLRVIRFVGKGGVRYAKPTQSFLKAKKAVLSLKFRPQNAQAIKLRRIRIRERTCHEHLAVPRYNSVCTFRISAAHEFDLTLRLTAAWWKQVEIYLSQRPVISQ